MALSSKVASMLQDSLQEGTGPTVGSMSTPIGTMVQSSSPSLSAHLGTTVWPPAALYTPRSTVGAMQPGVHRMGTNEDSGERHETLLDNLSRSATSLLPHPYTPRQKPTARIGMAPMRNQISRTGSIRYPPNNITRPFGVQRMASGTLGQPSISQAGRQSPSVSASPARVSSGRGYHGPAPQPLQWPNTTRQSSAMAPVGMSPGSVAQASSGVSRQSSCERPPSAMRHPPTGAPFIGSQSSVWPAAETFATLMSAALRESTASEVTRRTSVSTSGSMAAPPGTTPPSAKHGTDSNVTSAQRSAPPTVPKLPANGLTSCMNAKGAPPPQTLPVGGKGYSSIQLWTPRSQRQPGSEMKQATTMHEPREFSIEPPQVGRSPSASLSLSPRSYPSMACMALASQEEVPIHYLIWGRSSDHGEHENGKKLFNGAQ
jgi:hypothetical protein